MRADETTAVVCAPGGAGSALERARDALTCCELCELRCRVDRRAGQRGVCRLTDRTHVFRLYVSYAEELELSPALMVYLGGCNFRCGFCTQAPSCFVPEEGPALTAPETLALIERMSAGVSWINLIGGEPSLHPHAILALRRGVRTTARWLLNTNGYFTPECFELLDPCVDLHLVDFKFGNDGCAARLAGVDAYVETLRRNLLAVAAAGVDRLLVRHLLMPGHEACCFEPVAGWMAAHLPRVRFHLVASYVPNYRALKDDEMSRTVPVESLRAAQAFCRRLGLREVE